MLEDLQNKVQASLDAAKVAHEANVAAHQTMLDAIKAEADRVPTLADVKAVLDRVV